jgi:hypothetical protein
MIGVEVPGTVDPNALARAASSAGAGVVAIGVLALLGAVVATRCPCGRRKK